MQLREASGSGAVPVRGLRGVGESLPTETTEDQKEKGKKMSTQELGSLAKEARTRAGDAAEAALEAQGRGNAEAAQGWRKLSIEIADYGRRLDAVKWLREHAEGGA